MPRRKTNPDPLDDEEDLPDDDTPEVADAESAVLSRFASLADRLGRAAQGSAEETRVADRIFKLIEKLDPEAQKRLFARPEVKELFSVAAEAETPMSADTPPGTIIYRTIQGEKIAWSKKPWTWKDLYDPPPPRTPMPTKTWMNGDRKFDLFWNGLAVSLLPNEEYTLPEVFYGLWQDHVRNTKIAQEHAAWLMGKRHTLSDVSVVTEGGARSRALNNHEEPGKGNLYRPGGGMISLTDTPEPA